MHNQSEGGGPGPRPSAHLPLLLPSYYQGYYLSRSLALPSLSLAVPLVCSVRPSAFFSLSPVTAPVASLALPFAFSSAPSPLSWALLFLPTCSFSLLQTSSRVMLFYPFGETMVAISNAEKSRPKSEVVACLTFIASRYRPLCPFPKKKHRW